MIFAGLLDVISTEKVDVKLAKTLFVAPSITLSLTGTGGGLALSETVLCASAGACSLPSATKSRCKSADRASATTDHPTILARKVQSAASIGALDRRFKPAGVIMSVFGA